MTPGTVPSVQIHRFAFIAFGGQRPNNIQNRKTEISFRYCLNGIISNNIVFASSPFFNVVTKFYIMSDINFSWGSNIVITVAANTRYFKKFLCYSVPLSRVPDGLLVCHMQCNGISALFVIVTALC